MSKKLVFLCVMLALCLSPAVQAAKIIWVSDGYDERVDGQPDDQAAVDFLASQGYTVDYQRIGLGNGYWRTLDAAKIAALNAADLVICGRSHDSAQYATDATEVGQWNAIKAPLIHMSPYLPRNSRWAWYNNSTMSEDGGTPTLVAVDPHHPIFKGIDLNSKLEVDIYDQSVGSGTTGFMAVLEQGNGRLLAKAISGTRTIVAEWDAGKPFYAGSTYTPGGKRMMFCAGTREGSGFGRGEFNLNAEGKKVFVNAIEYMLGNLVKEPWVKAWQPDPADGTKNVSLPLLKWTKGDTAVLHDIYIGTTPELTAADRVAVKYPMAMYYPTIVLTPGTEYYWRVDEVELNGTTHTGDVWSFTTASVTAYEPAPRDGALWVDPNAATLLWWPGQNALTHDVYFGTDPAAVAAGTGDTAKGNQVAMAYDPGVLAQGTTYYWRVDEVLADGTKKTGAVWSFTTLAPGGGIRGFYFSNASLQGLPVRSQVDPQINFDWAAASPTGLPADGFSIRWVGELAVPYTETYTFYANTDDGVRLWVNDVPLLNLWTNRRAATEAKASIDLVGGQRYPLIMEFYNAEGNAIAQLSWESLSIPVGIIPQPAFSLPVRASSPYPNSEAVDVTQSPILVWSAGETAAQHEVYFGDDANAVAAATSADAAVYKGSQAADQTSFDPGSLEWNKTYYWRVDEVNAANGESPWMGTVWSFTTADFIVVDDFESYVDDVEGRIFQTWIDGWGFTEPAPGNPGNGTGSTVGYTDPPFAERVVVHSGRQAMPFDYNNIIQPYYSETERTFATAQNWKVNGVTDLVVWYRGSPVAYAETASGITMSAAGTDIWNGADEFRFAFKRLNGNGSIIAKVESIGNTNAWAKAGVMIRDTLEPGSKFAYLIVSPSSGVSFGRRPMTDSTTCESTTQASIVAPYWVKLTRTGNTIAAQLSADGKTWADINDGAGGLASVDLAMGTNIYIGLCVTSHNAAAVTTGVFSNITSSVAGPWEVALIGLTQSGNDVDQLYVGIQDSAGKFAVVTKPDATTVDAWTEWKVPLNEFTGVNLGAVKKMYIGVGDRKAPKADGAGELYIDDIRVMKPAP